MNRRGSFFSKRGCRSRSCALYFCCHLPESPTIPAVYIQLRTVFP